MPSLILETILTGKDLKAREKQAYKWFDDISLFHDISKDHYIQNEIIFRQCLMHEKFNTPFSYENEVTLKFPIKANDGLMTFNEAYFSKIKTGKNYAIHPLSFQKMDRIKSAEGAIKKQYANLDKLKDVFLELQKNNSEISPDNVLASLEEQKIKTNKDIELKILNNGNHSLKKFIDITKNGEIIVNHKGFEFLKTYSLITYCLWEPHWLSGHKPGTSKIKTLYGIHGYIAKKINFEFGSRLGFKASSKDVADKVRDNERLIGIYKAHLKSLGIDKLL